MVGPEHSQKLVKLKDYADSFLNMRIAGHALRMVGVQLSKVNEPDFTIENSCSLIGNYIYYSLKSASINKTLERKREEAGVYFPFPFAWDFMNLRTMLLASFLSEMQAGDYEDTKKWLKEQAEFFIRTNQSVERENNVLKLVSITPDVGLHYSPPIFDPWEDPEVIQSWKESKTVQK